MIDAACETFPLVATFLALAEATFLALDCIALHCIGPTERLAAFLALAEALLLDAVSNAFSMRSVFFFLRRLSDLAAEVHDAPPASTSCMVCKKASMAAQGRPTRSRLDEQPATHKDAI